MRGFIKKCKSKKEGCDFFYILTVFEEDKETKETKSASTIISAEVAKALHEYDKVKIFAGIGVEVNE